MATELDILIQKIDDPGLRSELAEHVRQLQQRRTFGLVFEEHTPERVKLPEYPIRAGSKVTMREDDVSPTYRVEGLDGDLVKIVKVAGHDGAKLTDEEALNAGVEVALRSAVVAVAEFGEPIYPGLRQLGSVTRGGDKPSHVVIKGENHHALEALQFTHAGKVDCIYIDPPYNTGGDFAYNDRRVAKEDAFRHSKWLAFMERRLKLAKNLLADTGVIIVAIDDNEQAHLRLLMDQVFGEDNFISNVVWQGSGSHLSRFTQGGLDYMLIYGRSVALTPTFRDPKPFAQDMLRAVSDALENGNTSIGAEEALRSLIEANHSKISPGLRGFNKVDAEGRVYDTADLTNGRYRPNLRYPITDPETGQVYAPPENGWKVSKDLMAQRVADGQLSFGGKYPRYKKYLSEYMDQLPLPSFTESRAGATQHLLSVLGTQRFSYSKNHKVLMRWIRMVMPEDGVLLDFFAGSGSTGEAVMRLNAEDGGSRQCILVTNNEVDETTAKHLAKDGYQPGNPEWEARGIFEHVTRPRIETVATGIRHDRSEYSEGLAENVEFVELTYQDPQEIELDMAFDAVAPLLWLKAGGQGPIITESLDSAGRRKPYAWTDRYAVLFNPDTWRSFAAKVPDSVGIVFIVTDSTSEFARIAGELPTDVEAVRLYENYLTTFTINEDHG